MSHDVLSEIGPRLAIRAASGNFLIADAHRLPLTRALLAAGDPPRYASSVQEVLVPAEMFLQQAA
jgi:hypothetical protein